MITLEDFKKKQLGLRSMTNMVIVGCFVVGMALAMSIIVLKIQTFSI